MEEPIKILMTADTVGGVWTYTMELCSGLQDYNMEIHLVTMGALLTPSQANQVHRLSNIKLYESNYKLEWMQDACEDVANAAKWVKNIYNAVQPHIMHFNNYGQNNGGFSCPVITVYHSCVQTWWRAVKGTAPPAPGWDWYTGILKNAISYSDVVVFPSMAIKGQAEGVFGKIKNARVLYNGRDTATGKVPKEPFILTAGRIWDEGKNVRLLCDIAAALTWPLYVAGDNGSNNAGNGAAPDNVHFTGKLPEKKMQEYMARASVFVSPAKYEPFGLAVLEAARAGCALALADIPTFREIWGNAALYFDPFSEDSAREVLKTLTDNKVLRNKMAVKAHNRAKKFTVKSMAVGYIKIYKQLLETKTHNHENKNVLPLTGLGLEPW